MSLFVSCVVSGGRTLVTAFATLVTRIESNTCRYPHTRLPVWVTNGSFNIALQSDCFVCHRAVFSYYVVLSVNLHNSQSVVLKQVCLCREENTVAPARVHVSSQPGGGILRRVTRYWYKRWFLSLRSMKPGPATPISNLCPRAMSQDGSYSCSVGH